MKKKTKTIIKLIAFCVAAISLFVCIRIMVADKTFDDGYEDVFRWSMVTLVASLITFSVLSGKRFYINGIPIQIKLPDKDGEQTQEDAPPVRRSEPARVPCPVCGQPTDPNAPFCSCCGTKTAAVCPNCKKPFEKGSIVCEHCDIDAL